MVPARLYWLAVLVWLPILALPLFSDDYDLIWAIRDRGIQGEWFARPALFFRPGTSILFAAQDWLFGDLAWPRHLVSLTAHLGCTLLVARLAKLLYPGTEVIAGLLFALWGCHGEAIAWMAAQGDLFAALLGLAYLIAALQHQLWAPILFLLACSFKESVLSLPLLAWLLRGRPDLTLLLALFWLALRAHFLGAWVVGYGTEVHFPSDILRYLASLLSFAIRSILPPILPHPVQITEWGVLLVAGGGVLGLYLQVWKSGKEELKLALAWVIATLPVLALGVRMDRFESERFLYLPSAITVIFLAPRVHILPLLLAQLVGVGLSQWAWFQSAQQVEAIQTWLTSQTLPPKIMLLPDGVRGTFSLRNGIIGLWRTTHPDHPATIRVPMRVGGQKNNLAISPQYTEQGWEFSSEQAWFQGGEPGHEGWYWDGVGMSFLAQPRE